MYIYGDIVFYAGAFCVAFNKILHRACLQTIVAPSLVVDVAVEAI